jgi:hypothetical protein
LDHLLTGLAFTSKIEHAIDNIWRCNTLKTKEIHQVTFETFKSQFERFSEQKAAIDVTDLLDSDHTIPSVLFDSSFAELSEAIRLDRAKAVVAVRNFDKNLITQKSVEDTIAEEKSPLVRKELQNALM